MGAGYSVSSNPPPGMSMAQGREYNRQREYYQQNLSVEANKRTAARELELAKLSGDLNNPYYDRFRTLQRTGSMSDAIETMNRGLAQPAAAAASARSGGGGGGSSNDSGGGMGMFLGGTTGVLPGNLGPGQPIGSGMGMGMGMGVEPPARFSPSILGFAGSVRQQYLKGGSKKEGGDNNKRRAALQSAYQKVLAAQNEGQPPAEGGGGADSGTPGIPGTPPTTPAQTGTRTTAAMVDDKGYVYGMGAVPGFGYNPYAGMAPGQTSPALAGFKQPTLTRQENKVLRRAGYTPESMYVEAMTPKTSYFGGQPQPYAYGQPMVMNSPFAGQYPVMNSPFAGQPPMMMNQPFAGQAPITRNPYFAQNPMTDGRFFGQPNASPYRQMPVGGMGSRPVRIA